MSNQQIHKSGLTNRVVPPSITPKTSGPSINNLSVLGSDPPQGTTDTAMCMIEQLLDVRAVTYE